VIAKRCDTDEAEDPDPVVGNDASAVEVVVCCGGSLDSLTVGVDEGADVIVESAEE